MRSLMFPCSTEGSLLDLKLLSFKREAEHHGVERLTDTIVQKATTRGSQCWQGGLLN